jgi:hypothetical protein
MPGEPRFKKGQRVKTRDAYKGYITDVWLDDDAYMYELNFFASDNYPLSDSDFADILEESQLLSVA